MRIVRNISLILLGIAIWVAGFIFISIPALDEWNDCWMMNRLDGKADSGFYCHVYEGNHGGSSCDDPMACLEVDAYSSEIITSVPELMIGLVLPAAPLIAIIVILVRPKLARSAINKKLKANTHSILKGPR